MDSPPGGACWSLLIALTSPHWRIPRPPFFDALMDLSLLSLRCWFFFLSFSPPPWCLSRLPPGSFPFCTMTAKKTVGIFCFSRRATGRGPCFTYETFFPSPFLPSDGMGLPFAYLFCICPYETWTCKRVAAGPDGPPFEPAPQVLTLSRPFKQWPPGPSSPCG